MIRLSKHARESVQLRAIALAWVEAAIAAPDSSTPDPRYPERTRSYKAIAEFGGRVLRVVHRPEGNDVLVITVHFDPGSEAMIRTSYDPETDALFVWFGPDGVTSAGTDEVAPGIMLDFDATGTVIGLEVLDVRKRTAAGKSEPARTAAE